MDDIVSADKEIIGNGVFITFNEEPCTIILEKHKNVKIEIHFAEDDSKEQKVSWGGKNNNSVLKIKFLNFNNVFGNSSIEHLNLGVLNNRAFFGRFIVSKLPKGSFYEVIYTFYLGDNVGH